MNTDLTPTPAESDMSIKATQTFRIPSSQSGTNASVAKQGATVLSAIEGYNSASEPVYVKLYNLDRVPNPATDVPKLSKPISGQSTFPVMTTSLAFTQGLAVAFTMGPLDTDTVGVGADQITGFNLLFT